MREIWIIGCGGSDADGVGFEFAVGDIDDIKQILVDKVERDKEWSDAWADGTENVDEVAERITGTLYAYSCFPDYHIDYEAIPLRKITMDACI